MADLLDDFSACGGRGPLDSLRSALRLNGPDRAR
jgi:hypothetical protein